MIKILSTLLFIISSLCVLSQEKNEADQFVDEGVKLHDAGKYSEAVRMYYTALTLQPNYPKALYELSYTYYVSKNYDSAILISNLLLGMNAPENILKNTYVTLGSIYDDLKQPNKAKDTYKEGLKKFPDFYLLHFNLGITYYFEEPPKNQLALESFQKAVTLNPFHAGSNYWQYKLLADQNMVPAVLVSLMLCIDEQNTKRSEECDGFIKTKLTPNIKSDSGKKNITIYLPSSSLSKSNENNFSAAELGLSLMAASSEVIDTLKLDDDIKKLSFQLQALFNFMGEGNKNKGFYWKFYAPFFYQLKQKNYIEMLVNIILMNSNKTSQDWFNAHQMEVSNFYDWIKKYKWNDTK